MRGGTSGRRSKSAQDTQSAGAKFEGARILTNDLIVMLGRLKGEARSFACMRVHASAAAAMALHLGCGCGAPACMHACHSREGALQNSDGAYSQDIFNFGARPARAVCSSADAGIWAGSRPICSPTSLPAGSISWPLARLRCSKSAPSAHAMLRVTAALPTPALLADSTPRPPLARSHHLVPPRTPRQPHRQRSL
jgi:hypothetical protein